MRTYMCIPFVVAVIVVVEKGVGEEKKHATNGFFITFVFVVYLPKKTDKIPIY